MNGLATRLRALADRSDGTDYTQFMHVHLTEAALEGMIDDLEFYVKVVFGNPDGEMPKGKA